MNKRTNLHAPILAVSSCLVGENVRYDGSSKCHTYISETLDMHLDLFPICPEVAIGMGVPRSPIHLQIIDYKIRAICIDDRAQDVTMALQAYGKQQASHARAFCGYIFKSRSPSCGVSDTDIYCDEDIIAGAGIYAREIVLTLPYLPVIDEAQLDQAEIRDSFLERVFSLARWHRAYTMPMTMSRLRDFHAMHYLTLTARSGNANKALSESISGMPNPLPHQAVTNYLTQLHNHLKTPLAFRDHVGLLIKIQQRLAPVISSEETDKLNTGICKYRINQENLATPIQLIKRLADKYNLYDLSRQSYINPIPAEITLRYRQ